MTSTLSANSTGETPSDERFAFGRNWQSFLELLSEERIAEAEASLRERLGDLRGRSFLDVGSGSGLFSLAAMRLGATRVHSFDFDPESVACTRELRRRFFPEEPNWTVEQGSVLDAGYVGSLGEWDVVYSWGVLHHTGDLWRAMEIAATAVAPDGRLFIALYNDQGMRSRLWKLVKRNYARSPAWAQVALVGAALGSREILGFAKRVITGGPGAWRFRHEEERGMDRWHNMVDWVGGYPFEVARPDDVFDFYRHRGFELEWLRTVGGSLGCNEFVMCRRPPAQS